MTNLITDLREAADWLAEELPVEVRIGEAPQFLDGDPTHDQLIAFAVEKMREAADKIDKDRDMDVSLMELLAKIEERALEDVADKAGAEDAEEKSYLTGRIRGLRLAEAMLKDAFPREVPK